MQLKMLTDDKQCAHICEEYWRKDEAGKFVLTVQEIANTHEMKPHLVSKYVEQHCRVWLAEISCGRCKRPYSFSTRAQYIERNRYTGQTCSSCAEIELQVIAYTKRDLIVKMRQPAESSDVDFRSLDLKSLIYLFVAIQALSDENFNTIEPLTDYPACTLSPDVIYDLDILQHLIDNKLLLISLKTSLEAIELCGDINLAISTFDIALDQQDTEKLINNFSDISTEKINCTTGFIELCREIQMSECLVFLNALLAEHQLSFVPGEKTKQVISGCLEVLSVAQVYNFIWRAVTNAAAYYMRSPVSKRQAANSVVGSISRYMEQSLANDWDVKPFKRNYKFPQSTLSRIVFGTVLGTDDGGFNQPLHQLLKV